MGSVLRFFSQSQKVQMEGGQAVSIIDQIAFDQIADERDKAQQENKLLKDRIKRLEEAGDKMFWTLDAEETGSVGKEMWRKAKEAKP
jgi:hypothetical protein